MGSPAVTLPPPRGELRAPSETGKSVYSTAFWIAYAANVSVVAANSLTFRFAELVDFLGGREQTAGLIVGVATLCALLSRLGMGQALDRYGVRRLWLASSGVFLVGGVMLALTSRLDWTLYAARGLFAVGVAGMVTCSTVHIQNLVPADRRTEVIGSLGSSGFVGMITGAVAGDVIFAHFDGQMRYAVLFGTATLVGLWYLVLVLVLTRRERHVRPGETPPLHRLLIRYWPGNVMLVALAMGTMLSVTTVFLTRFATHRGLSGLGPFFAAYSVSAFTFRLASRNWSRTVGRHRMILLGLIGHCGAMLLLPVVGAEWQFLFPAMLGGFGHALLFPAVVSLGSEPFPLAYRGTATTLVLGFFEVGMFLSAPLLGWVIDHFEAGFTQMFHCAAVVAASVAVIYALTSARRPDADYNGRERSPGVWFGGDFFGWRRAARGRSATALSAHEKSACEAFARESSVGEIEGFDDEKADPGSRGTCAAECLVGEGLSSDSSGSEPIDSTRSAPEGSAREGLTHEPFAREPFVTGSAVESESARQPFARQGTAARCG